MMVAAYAAEVRLAHQLGLRSANLRRPDEYDPDRPPEAPPAEAEVFVDGLGELADRLGC